MSSHKPINNVNKKILVEYIYHQEIEHNNINHSTIHINMQTNTCTLTIKHIYTLYI